MRSRRGLPTAVGWRGQPIAGAPARCWICGCMTRAPGTCGSLRASPHPPWGRRGLPMARVSPCLTWTESGAPRVWRWLMSPPVPPPQFTRSCSVPAPQLGRLMASTCSSRRCNDTPPAFARGPTSSSPFPSMGVLRCGMFRCRTFPSMPGWGQAPLFPPTAHSWRRCTKGNSP